jgi:hypothetical protein
VYFKRRTLACVSDATRGWVRVPQLHLLVMSRGLRADLRHSPGPDAAPVEQHRLQGRTLQVRIMLASHIMLHGPYGVLPRVFSSHFHGAPSP